MNYTQAGLERLYQAIKAQAEQDFLQAIKREYPGISEHDMQEILNYWHHLRAKAEARLVREQQSRGKQE